MPELPEKRYLRRGAVRKYFGIAEREFVKLVEAEVFTPVYLMGKGRAYFRRDLVLKAEAEGKIFRAEKAGKKS